MKGEDVESGVRRWIEQSGFPLQMQVAHAASQARPRCFELTQGGYYTDPDSGKKREGDVIVDWAAMEDYGSVSLRIALECKNVVKPWVVFTDDADSLLAMETGTMPQSLYIETSGLNEHTIYRINSTLWKSPLQDLVPQRVGSVVQEAHSPKNSADDAIRQAVATAIGSARDETEGLNERQYIAAAPVVVTNGPLFTCDFDIAVGDFELRATDWAAVRTQHRNGYSSKIAFVLRPPALGSFFSVVSSCKGALESAVLALNDAQPT